MSMWENRRVSALEKEKASQRLDCFLSVLYLFPNCLHVEDMENLRIREEKLTQVTRYGGQGFFCMYTIGFMGAVASRRALFFRDFLKHSILCVGGSFVSAKLAEKVAAETVYNQMLIDMANKYNFTPEEVTDLQRNLNQYYIQKDREADLNKE